MMQSRTCRTYVLKMVGTCAALMCAAPVFAVDVVDDPVQIDESAAQVVQTSNTLCWEMFRYHQQQPDYQQAYRSAKELWRKTGELRDAMRAGTMETDVMIDQVNQLNDSFKSLETTLGKWQSGDRSQVANNSGPTQRTYVTPGAEIDLPFVGISVGRPRVVVAEDGPPQLERRRLHPNGPGSKRNLERQMTALKVALSYLVEDANTPSPPNSTESDAPSATTPAPEPPTPDPTLNENQDAQPIPKQAKKATP